MSLLKFKLFVTCSTKGFEYFDKLIAMGCSIECLFFRAGSLLFIIFPMLFPRTSSNDSDSDYIIAAGRYIVATYHSIIAVNAALIHRDPVSHRYTNCSSCHSLLTRKRATNPSPQLEFEYIKRETKKTLQHPLFQEVEIVRGKKAGRGVGNNSTISAIRRIGHALKAMLTVVEASCESMVPSCASVTTSKTRNTRSADETHDDKSEKDSDAEFDVYYVENFQVDANADQEAHELEEVEDSEVSIGLIYHDFRQQQNSRPRTNSRRRDSFMQQLGRLQCVVLELQAKYQLASVTAGERAAVGHNGGFLLTAMALLVLILVGR